MIQLSAKTSACQKNKTKQNGTKQKQALYFAFLKNNWYLYFTELLYAYDALGLLV